MDQSKKLFVMAGGTGGHVFPGLVVANELQAQGWQIRWLGTADRMEADLVPAHGIEIDFIKIKGLRGKGLKQWLLAPYKLFAAVMQARRSMQQWRPDVVLGMGGFVSGPGGIAAWSLGIPVVVHEQNAVAGLTNRGLSLVAAHVLQAFPNTFKKGRVVGNPVRAELLTLPDVRTRYQQRQGGLNILVMGGSQGARAINEIMPQVLARYEGEYQLIHQVGKGNVAAISELYQQQQLASEQLVEFIDDVAQAYCWADVVICRSGALTVSEISAVGVAAIFIPFQHQDRQQALNAQYLIDLQAAHMIEQQDLTVDSLLAQLAQYDRKGWQEMALRAQKASQSNAAQQVAQCLIESSER